MTRRLRIPFVRDAHECEEARALMSDYLDRELDGESERRVERHARFCPRCRRVLANLRATIELLSHVEPTDSTGTERELGPDRILLRWHEQHRVTAKTGDETASNRRTSAASYHGEST